MNHLVNTYGFQGRGKEVQKLCELALETTRQVLGIEHQTILGGLNDLGLIHIDRVRYDEAEPLYLETLEEGKIQKLGSKHTKTKNL